MEQRVKAVIKSITKEMKDDGIECTAVVKIGSGYSSTSFSIPGNGFVPGQEVQVTVSEVTAS